MQTRTCFNGGEQSPELAARCDLDAYIDVYKRQTQLNAEKTILGNCIDGGDKVAALIEQGFTKAHFVLLAHQKVWSAFEALARTCLLYTSIFIIDTPKTKNNID